MPTERIDLTQFEGHTPKPWGGNYRAIYGPLKVHDAHCRGIYGQDIIPSPPDMLLIINAPDLKDEVARLRESLALLSSLLSDFRVWAEQHTLELPEDYDPWHAALGVAQDMAEHFSGGNQ